MDQNNLPSIRTRKASYNLLSLVRETAKETVKDLERIRDAEQSQTNKTFQWKQNRRGVWWLSINE